MGGDVRGMFGVSTQPLPIGTRVRLNERCVWPKRVGKTATVVDPPIPGVYPDENKWGRHVCLLVDDDPFPQRHDGWSCVTTVDTCDVLEGGS